ncbi:unannotated protein [freshwater metagenome]|uniref:Unannotated protein n=1 Tax=freshwater metagenome TaxID=449393 RepID=A0A6J6Z0U9_9ZZZZ
MPSTRGVVDSATLTATRSSSLADSPIKSPFISTASTMAMPTSSAPMAMEPTASHRGLPVTSDIVRPNSANTRPVSAPTSSSSTTGSSGAFAVRMKFHHVRPLRTWLASFTAVRSEYDSSRIAMPRMTNAMVALSTSCGCCTLLIPS